MAAPPPLSAFALLSAGITLLAACSKDTTLLTTPGAASPASAAPATPPKAAPTPPPQPTEVALAPQRFQRAKLGFDGLADIEPHLFAWDVGGVFSQVRILATNDERFSILVRAHGDETLASFEHEHESYTLSKRSSLQICGRSAEIVRATREEEHITCVMVAPPGHNHPAYIPVVGPVGMQVRRWSLLDHAL